MIVKLKCIINHWFMRRARHFDKRSWAQVIVIWWKEPTTRRKSSSYVNIFEIFFHRLTFFLTKIKIIRYNHASILISSNVLNHNMGADQIVNTAKSIKIFKPRNGFSKWVCSQSITLVFKFVKYTFLTSCISPTLT